MGSELVVNDDEKELEIMVKGSVNVLTQYASKKTNRDNKK